MTNKKSTIRKQQGFVSIIVAAVLMVLLSLVTIGFSRIMQREQRQAIDRQLSTQAFYAAETAVNDVYQAIVDNASIADEKNSCSVVDWPLGVGNGVIDPADDSVAYTCLQYDKTPTDLVFTDSITTDSSKIFPVQPATSGETVSSITFTWNGEQGSTLIDPSANNCTNPNNFLPRSFASGSVPLLRLDLIPSPTSGYTREFLADNTANLYLYPKTCGTNNVNYGSVSGLAGGGQKNTGQVVGVRCNDPANSGCQVTISGLSLDRYHVRLKSLYTNVGTMTVTAISSAGSMEFKGAQTKVDATGRASDVLRRIDVRISNGPRYNYPEGVVEAKEGFCKEIGIAPDATAPVVNDADCY